ncbi:6-phosphogluconolactonase [Aphanothece hegewaldii CCALA 016]|uniref:6-phosphogluconolactonase n=1 Tax=Aphanothece hegewaldii CCALA 016 TaxID=2107694 RepID=A0A2T1LWS3_9CHRO|nr:6-phosphogluconolactonase [Aphanothece hegewaldii]PSF36286.1 6-phosphogluconolactonase [Aphanothece hegewaldii CCALA 016]
MKKQVITLNDKESLVQQGLTLVLEKINQAIQQRGECTLVLSGGSTPKPLYEALAEQSLPWDKIYIFWGDERYVSPDDPDSNQGMTRKAMLDRIEIPASNIYGMPTDSNDPALDAQKYETALQEYFKVSWGEFPAFDVVLLGMGDDGHTASLFPHTEALHVSDRLITVGSKDGQPRLTFTASLINHARCVIFLVAGASKQTALAEVFAPDGDAMTYPSRLIQPEGELWWLLDRRAAENLDL